MRRSFDSPPEETFYTYANNYFGDTCTVDCHIPVSTEWGEFIIDFVISPDKGRPSAIEIDGKSYHNKFRDEFRDALLLGTCQNLCDVIHIDAMSLAEDPQTIFWLIGKWHPEWFRRTQLIRLAGSRNDEQRRAVREILDVSDNFRFGLWDEAPIERSTKSPPQFRDHWPILWNFAINFKGVKIDTIIDLYKRCLFSDMFTVRDLGRDPSKAKVKKAQ